jgi:XRE family aerobic/anaerobic benzoate catabolism transcriptional regulator
MKVTPIHEPSELIMRLAERVRAARSKAGMPRRELSELSGVSPRYLAQLEAGEGNISVLLLERVASALELRIEDFLVSGTPFSEDTQRVAQLYQGAHSEVQGKIRNLLAPQIQTAQRAQRVCLIGLRGAGKSTLGKGTAKALRLPYVELNNVIEGQVGMPMSEIHGLYGQDGFRAMENEALNSVIKDHSRVIMAVGGGLVNDTETYANLRAHFHTIWISATPAEHMQRVREQGDLRPMEGNPAAMDQLKSLLQTRMPLYEQALAQVNTSNRPEQSSINDVLAVIAKHRFIDKPGP